MSHMPPVPPANRSNKGIHSSTGAKTDTSKTGKGPANASEQGDTANIRQNTKNIARQHGHSARGGKV